MSNVTPAEQKVDQMLEILSSVGFPLAERTPRMRRRLARIFLAVCKIEPTTPWEDAAAPINEVQWAPRSRDIIDFINKHYGESISPGSYDDIRRKNLDYLVEAKLASKSARRPDSNTNDGTRGYALNPQAAALIQSYGKPDWKSHVDAFVSVAGRLDALLERKRERRGAPVSLPGGIDVILREGPHNALQRAIVEHLIPHFVLEPVVLYIGDSDSKKLHSEDALLRDIGLFELSHDRLPDIVVLDKARKWVFFIEAVHTSNPMSPLRHLMLERAASDCKLGIVFVSAFMDRKSLARWLPYISWETEVWLADTPDHMIHFNGDRFLGPHKEPSADQ